MLQVSTTSAEKDFPNSHQRHQTQAQVPEDREVMEDVCRLRECRHGQPLIVIIYETRSSQQGAEYQIELADL